MAVNLYTHQGENVAKTWVLMAVFLGAVVGLGGIASWYFHSHVILYVALVFALITNIWSYWYSDKVALSMSGAEPADDPKYIELNRVVENLAITAGLPKPRVYVIEDDAPNAFATGRDKNHAAVAVTIGLLNMMNRSELEGVLAHELSHIGNRDILLSTVAVVLVGFVAMLSDLLLWGGGGSDDEEKNPVAIVLAIVAMILAPIVANLIQLAISRRREYLADASGALLTRYPEGLASALQKIGTYSEPMERASNATAHLFISNPFGAESSSGVGGKVANLFSTHPPIADRIKALVG